MKKMAAVVLLMACMVFGSAFAGTMGTVDPPRAKQDTTMMKKHPKHVAAKMKKAGKKSEKKAEKKAEKKSTMKKHPKKEKKESEEKTNN